ncbi:hypothetical protein FA727_22995 [Robertmurraya kyonggiensis]|uniref:Uncharacterized protein n=1 Tax=Robertmurraya kyonggiensis TaxID=1037680 RepID=A0A4U1D0E9_9BACI|nr:hypothetical protein FA727_22995 [Robertmurraya kyonggiensis]
MFKIFYSISILISGLLFYVSNHMTQTLNINSEFGIVGGNGNPGLFPWIFLFPFFLFFVYGTIKLSMRLLTKLAKAKILQEEGFEKRVSVIQINFPV